MKLLAGTSAARIVSLLLSPIIGRLFLPETFGEYSVYLSYVGIAALFFTLRYELLFFSLKNNRDVVSIFKFVNVAIVTFSLLAFVGLFFVSSRETFKNIYFLGPIAAIIGAQYILFSNLFLKKKLFGVYSRAAFVSAASVPIMQCSAYFVGFRTTGLIVGQLAAQIVTAIIMYHYGTVFFRYGRTKGWWTRARNLALKNLDFPFKTLPQKYLSQFHGLFFVILLAMHYDEALVGVVAMGMKLLTIPVSLVLQSVASVALQRISYLGDSRAQLKFIGMQQLKLSAMSILPFAIFFWYAEEIAVLILGSNWNGTGQYIRYLIPFYFLQTVFHPIINVFYVNKWINQVLAAEFARTLLMVVALLIGIKYFAIGGVFGLYTFACLVGYCILSATLVHTVRKKSVERPYSNT